MRSHLTRIGAVAATAALTFGAAACEADDGTSPGQEAPQDDGGGDTGDAGDGDDGGVGY